eukprot:1194595-Prorocentrum_minimum.AAC.6
MAGSPIRTNDTESGPPADPLLNIHNEPPPGVVYRAVGFSALTVAALLLTLAPLHCPAAHSCTLALLHACTALPCSSHCCTALLPCTLPQVSSCDADADEADQRGCTLLMYAARGGNTEAVTSLLTQDAMVDSTDQDGLTPLMHAAMCGHGYPPVHKGYPPVHKGYPPVHKDYPQGHKGYPPVHKGYPLVHKGYPLVHWLLFCHAGAASYLTVGYYSVTQVPVAKVLLKHDADVDDMADDGRTALMLAAETGHANMVTPRHGHCRIDR